jgi:hypothetical protein
VAFLLWRKDVCILIKDIWLPYFTSLAILKQVELGKMYEWICIGEVSSFTFQRTYAQFDLAALVSVLDIDQTMTDELALLDKSMYPSVASREQLLVNILRKTFFIQMGR